MGVPFPWYWLILTPVLLFQIGIRNSGGAYSNFLTIEQWISVIGSELIKRDPMTD